MKGVTALTMINAAEGKVVWTSAPIAGERSIRRASHGAIFWMDLKERSDARAETGAVRVDRKSQT